MPLADRRVVFDPQPPPEPEAVLEVALIGHCPGPADWRRLLQFPALVAELEALGHGRALARLRELAAGAVPGPGDDALQALYRLPIPLQSPTQFQALFPEAGRHPTRYRSRLAGDRAWLPQAVADFFTADTGTGRRLWVIRVAEREGIDAFRAHPSAGLVQTPAPGAFETALLLPRIGLLALPDLERLLIPADLAAGPPPAPPEGPQPQFVPCPRPVDADHRERRRPPPAREAPPRPGLDELIGPMLASLARYRPDLHCLLGFPLGPQGTAGQARPDPVALEALRRLQRSHNVGALHRLQLLFPYLRRPGVALASPVGLIAGRMAAVTAQRGPWHAIAGQPLPGAYRPLPALNQGEATALREDPGLGVLLRRDGDLVLDDERLPGPVFGATGVAARSGEVARFVGWLRRQLQAYGEQLIFDADPRDPRPLLALERFLARLYALGALRGRRPEEAYRLQQLPAVAGVLLFEIELAPAYPIDRIRVHLSQDPVGGGWNLELSNA